VCDTKARSVTEQADIDLVERTLHAALESVDFDFGNLMENARSQSRHRLVQEIEFPTRIVIDNKAHPTYTLIQIQTPDRIGLLYDLLSCLDREGVSITLSRISTQNGAAIDTLYVADRSSRSKITDSQRIAALQKHLQLATLKGSEG
jgi:[protein-PII] uridylyltransferase